MYRIPHKYAPQSVVETLPDNNNHVHGDVKPMARLLLMEPPLAFRVSCVAMRSLTMHTRNYYDYYYSHMELEWARLYIVLSLRMTPSPPSSFVARSICMHYANAFRGRPHPDIAVIGCVGSS